MESKNKIVLNSKYKSNKQEGKDRQVMHLIARIFINKVANGLKTVPYCMSDIVKGSRGLIITLEADI